MLTLAKAKNTDSEGSESEDKFVNIDHKQKGVVQQ